jgi:nicotinamidase-related amidase
LNGRSTKRASYPDEIRKHLGAAAKIFEKDFFDITREEEIDHYIVRLNRRQAIVAGCETDVCVLQSCLGLLDRGHEVYVVEDLFSSSRTIDAAITRIRASIGGGTEKRALRHSLRGDQFD